MDGCFPLKDCILSVSQFTGAERESLVELAKHLGAKYGDIAVPLLFYIEGALIDLATACYQTISVLNSLIVELYDGQSEELIRWRYVSLKWLQKSGSSIRTTK